VSSSGSSVDPRLGREVQRQLRFVQKSCLLFDQGDHDEALRIAIAARVLFHQTARSNALVHQLGAELVEMMSSVEPLPAGAIQLGSGLYDNETQFQSKPTADGTGTETVFLSRMVPILGRRGLYPMPLPVWWRQEVCYSGTPAAISRKDFVLWTANKEEPHIDLNVDPKFAAQRDPSTEFTVSAGDSPAEPVIFEDRHLVQLRQIGFEILCSPALLALSS